MTDCGASSSSDLGRRDVCFGGVDVGIYMTVNSMLAGQIRMDLRSALAATNDFDSAKPPYEVVELG